MSIRKINNKAIHDGTDYTMHSLHAVDSILTSEIKNPNGTTGLTIDENGYSVMPNRPAFRAYSPTGRFSLSSGHTYPFNQTEYNIGNHYNTSNYRFFAPTDGLYHFNFYSIYEGLVTNLSLNLYKNGARIMGGDSHESAPSGASGQWHTITWVGDIMLNENEYVEVVNRDRDISYHGYNWAAFSGHFIG